MKNYLFKIALPAIVSAFMLSSCLGDSKNSFEGSEQFGVIHTDESGRKFAVVSGGYGPTKISAPEIEKLPKGNCYLFSYKIDDLGGTTNSVYTATLNTEPQIISSINFNESAVTPNDDYVAASTLSITCPGQIGDPTGFWYNHNWIIKYNATNLPENHVAVAVVFFDENRQYEKTETNGTPIPLEKNQMIFDIRFIQTPVLAGFQKMGETLVVVNLADVAEKNTFFQPTIGTEDGVYAVAKFRYEVANQDPSKEPELKLLGTWDLPTSNKYSTYFIFEK